MLLAYHFNKLKKPHQRGTNVASKGTVAYEMAMDFNFGESTTDLVNVELPDTYNKHDGLIRIQNPWFFKANKHV